jgi:hypothetical protein
MLKNLEKIANPKKAKEMAKYMKTDQFFYGVQAPQRRKVLQGGHFASPKFTIIRCSQRTSISGNSHKIIR